MKVLEKKHVHSDSVSGCSLLLEVGPQNESYLATVSLDGGLEVYSLSLEDSQEKSVADSSRRGFTGTLSRFPYLGMNQSAAVESKLSQFRSHTSSDPLACLALTSDGNGGHVVFSGGHDDVVLAYGINSGCAVASVYSHRDAVTGIDLIPRSSSAAENAIWSETSTHIMISGSWDATVKVWSVAVASGETVSINREPLAELFDAESSVVSISAIAVANLGVAISAGCADGSFVAWLFHDDGTKVMIHKEPARRGAGPCSAVRWTEEAGETYLFAGFANGKIASFALSNGTLLKISAVSIGTAVRGTIATCNMRYTSMR
jgi:WD40 repeat protein